MRQRLATVLELSGFTAVVVGLALISPPVGLIALGGGALLTSWVLSR